MFAQDTFFHLARPFTTLFETQSALCLLIRQFRKLQSSSVFLPSPWMQRRRTIPSLELALCPATAASEAAPLCPPGRGRRLGANRPHVGAQVQSPRPTLSSWPHALTEPALPRRPAQGAWCSPVNLPMRSRPPGLRVPIQPCFWTRPWERVLIGFPRRGQDSFETRTTSGSARPEVIWYLWSPGYKV